MSVSPYKIGEAVFVAGEAVEGPVEKPGQRGGVDVVADFEIFQILKIKFEVVIEFFELDKSRGPLEREAELEKPAEHEVQPQVPTCRFLFEE